MIGHGRPASLLIALARAAIVLCAYFTSQSAAQNLPPSEPVQLRITWGGGEPSRWVGRIMVDDGSLSSLKLLGSNADAAASLWAEDGQVRVATLSAHKRDSVEVLAQSTANTKLLIDLAPPDKGPAPRLEIPLADLPRHPYQVRVDDRGNTLEVQIIPQTGLRVSIKDRELPIFSPSEQCSFETSASLANLQPGTALFVQATLTPARNKDILWKSENQRLPVPVDGHPKLEINVPLPREEGVYTIHISAARPSGFERFWSASTRLAERSFQIVVLDSTPPAPAASARWESELEIDPTNPRWFERLPTWTQVGRIPGLNHGALGSSRANAVDLSMGRFVELLPTSAAGAHWQAYSLPLQAVGVPHLLEIDYQAQAEQSLGISIIEPNAGGVVSGLNRDAGVYVEGLGRSEAKEKQTHRLVFWPRTQAPLLVVSNLNSTGLALFGQIRVYKRSSNQLSAGLSIGPILHDRLVAAYLARPTVAETFGATRAIDPSSIVNGTPAECLDDCETAYESATRLADYLRYSGYNSAIISIPPGDRAPLSSQPSSVPSPIVDPLELTLRIFDREGISLLPAIDFASPLAELETIRRKSDPHTSGLEWVGADGRSWLEANGARSGRAPYYNLLDPRVQQFALKHISDLVDRYGRHRAFAGLAVRLSSDGYAQLPPLDWGLDDATIERFQHDTHIQLADAGPDRFATRYSRLMGQHADAWRTWRAAKVTAFYSQIASIIRGNSDRRLLLTTEDVFADPQLAGRLRPNLLRETTSDGVAAVMRDVGLDRQALERVPGLVFCPTRFVEPKSPLPDRAVDLQLNEAFARWHQPSSSSESRAAELYHHPVRQKLASFEAARIAGVSGEMQLAAQPLPDTASIRQSYLEAVADNDPAILIDGGEQLPLGQEELLREVRSTIAQLPITAAVSEVAKQPISVRTYAEANRTTLLVMNRSPWHCDARITLDLPQAAILLPLPTTPNEINAANKPLSLNAGRQPWPLTLGPYEIRAVRIAAAGPTVVDVQADLGDGANTELAAWLADLNHRDLTAPHLYSALANPSFEPLPGAGPLTGWHLTTGSGKATVELDPANPQDGKTSLHLRCDGQGAVIESDRFNIPSTGQLAMTVFARGQNFGPTTELRIVFFADQDGQAFRRLASVPTADMQRPVGQWGAPFAILVPDMPLGSQGQMRITFEMTGPGEVWLDNAKLYDLLFSFKNAQPEVVQLYKQIYAAKSAFDARQISDCVRILDGYWPWFIIANRPLVQPAIAGPVAPKNQQASPPQPNEGQEPTPGIGEHFKRLVPIWR